jgi:Acetyltransferase (GNAT) domain
LTALVRAFAPRLPELDESAWRRFAGEDDATRELTRALFVAHAESVDNPCWVASSWRGEELRGVALAMLETHARERRVLVVWVPAAHLGAHGSGVWITRGADAADVARELTGALTAHAGTLGVERLVIASCPEDDAGLARAAADAGGRAFPAPPEHQLVVPSSAAAAPFDAHLAALGRKRGWKVRRDLRRPADAGAALAVESPPSPATLEALWPLLQATLARRGSRLATGRANLLAAIVARVPPGAASVTICTRDGRVLGFLFQLRAGDTTQFNYFGHAAAPPLHVSSSLWAAAVKAELERGARRLLLGMTGETQKQRLGATPLARVHHYIPC